MFKYVLVASIVLLTVGCNKFGAAFKHTITSEYPVLYTSVYERNGSAILEFIDATEDSAAKQQAWRALINTPVPDTDVLLDKVISANTEEAWASLWFKDLSTAQLLRLQELWEENPGAYNGLAVVLGMKGDNQTLKLLLERPAHELNGLQEFETAYAVGLLTARFNVPQDEQLAIVERALASNRADVTRAYLYGYYRTGKELHAAVADSLYNEWKDLARSSEVDQYAMKILMPTHFIDVLTVYELPDYTEAEPRLAIEVALAVAKQPEEDYTALILSSLLGHKNPNVLLTVLHIIQENPDFAETLSGGIVSKIIREESLDAAVRLEGINTIPSSSRYRELAEQLAGDKPYLQSVKYAIFRDFLTNVEFFELLKSDIESEQINRRFFAAEEFSRWWGELDETEKTAEQIEQAKNLLQTTMQQADRSVIYGISDLMKDEELLPDSDFGLIPDMLNRFKLLEDIEIYQRIAEICEIRFKDQSKSLIDSLARLGNAALNQALKSQGWEVETTEEAKIKFRNPDWKRLAKLGPHPVLNLYTHKGVIGIKLNTLVAPATIAGIDSLVSAGAYNGVAFHRVIPNFVIQGGDVESGDGMGGPGYIVPTEGSAAQFFRGKTGMASAGIDTEGSQYFIMHQWAPHLNGRYAVIGEVVQGMEVVDRIIIGDVVRRATISEN